LNQGEEEMERARAQGILVCMIAVAGAIDASCALQVEESEPEEEVGSHAQAIINGWPFTSASREARASVMIWNEPFEWHDTYVRGLGSGVLVRSNMVLTARHVVSLGRFDYRPQEPGNIEVRTADATEGSCSSLAGCTTARYNLHYATGGIGIGEDVALLILEDDLPGFEGRTAGHFTPIYRHDPLWYEGADIMCTGYGNNAADDPTLKGFLQVGFMQVARDFFPQHVFHANPGRYGQQLTGGDSGAGCWSGALSGSNKPSETYPRAALGVLSTVGTAGGNMQNPVHYKHWVREQIAERTADYYNPFHYPRSLTGWEISEPLGRTCSNWSMPGGGKLIQSANCGYSNGTGTAAVDTRYVLDNGLIELKVIATNGDNDRGGIAFRYVDENHYYAYYVDMERRRVAIAKRTPEGMQILRSEPLSYNFPVTLQLIAYDDWFYGIVNGVHLAVVARDQEYPLGWVGAYGWYLQAQYDDLRVTVMNPAEQEYIWPHE
jgi:hypothetical protein